MARWCSLLALLLAGCIPARQIDRGKDRDGDGYIAVQLGGDDCRDDLPSVHPGAQEVCGNGIDDNCDGVVDDDGVGARTWYRDEDGDGYGDPNESTTACTAPDGYVADSSDCDDQRAAVHPGAQEVCGNGLDDDCNGKTDDNGLGASVWYLDHDGDGYGDAASPITACSAPPNYVATPGDCNDDDSAVHPGAEEICNNHVDDNCDGSPAPCELRGDVSLAFANQRFLGTGVGARLGYSIAVWPGSGGSAQVALSSGNDDVFYQHYVQGAAWYGLLTDQDQRTTVDGVAAATTWPSDPQHYLRTGSAVSLCDIAGGSGLDMVIADGIYDPGNTPLEQVLVDSAIRVLSDVSDGGSLNPADSVVMVQSSTLLLAPAWCGPMTEGSESDVVIQAGPRDVGVARGGQSGALDFSDVDLVITDSQLLQLLGVGDLDHDGVVDLLVGDGARSLGVFSGSDQGTRDLGSADWSVSVPSDLQVGLGASILDVDGDGFEDLLLADVTSDGVGALDIWYGPVTASTHSTCRILGRPQDPIMASDIGDFNGDGRVDLVVQDIQDSTAGAGAGAFHIFYDVGRCTGTTSLTDADVTLYGEVAGGAFQPPDRGVTRRARRVDIDGDGVDDLVLSFPYATLQYEQAGAVYVIMGSGM